MLRTVFVLLVMLAGLLFVLFVVTDDSPKKRIALSPESYNSGSY